jgi:hypothetical protein
MGPVRRIVYIVARTLVYLVIAVVYANPAGAQTRISNEDFKFEASVSANCFAQYGMTGASADCAMRVLSAEDIDRCFAAADDGVRCFGDNPILASMIRIKRDVAVFQTNGPRNYLTTAFR